MGNKVATIVVVEDEAITAMDIKSTLEEAGYIVPGTASSGAEALELIETCKPDLVLMDIVIQGDMDGTEVAKLVTEKYNIPIVFLSAYGDEDTFSRAKLSAPYSYLTKPYHNKDLKMAIELSLFKHETNSKLVLSELRFHHAFDYAGIGMALISPEGIFLQVNRTLTCMLDYSETAFLTLTLNKIIHKNDFSQLLHYMKIILDERSPSIQSEIRLTGKDTKLVWGLLTLSLVKIKKKPLYFIFQIQDISQQKRAQEEVFFLNKYDPITGLVKRNVMEHYINESIATQKENNKIALLFIDLDHFKRINEILGHQLGDELLIAVGTRLKDLINPLDLIARLGGDEFILIIRNIFKTDDAMKIAEKIQSAFNTPFEIQNHHLHVSVSIGIALYPEDGSDAKTLIQKADIAVHYAKIEGRNRYQFSTAEITKQAKDQVKFEKKLRSAIQKKQFLLFYQPKVNLKTNKVEGVEALLRWKEPKKPPILPKEFIGIAEDTGLILELGLFVLREACQQIMQWTQQGLNLKIAVNLSPRQFYNLTLVEQITAVLKEYNCPPSKIEFEITEGILMKDKALSKRILEKIKALGIKIALDDFGTGYSSLNYLQHFPIDILKIDQVFIRNDSKRNKDIVRTIINLAHIFQLSVVAEGVESKEQLEFLKANHCEEAQGFYLSPPLPPSELVKQIKERFDT